MADVLTEDMLLNVELARSSIMDRARELHRASFRSEAFVPGVTPIWPSGAVLDETDLVEMIDSVLDMRIASGPKAKQFERLFSRLIGVRTSHLCNSGSSANLLALSALFSPLLGERALRPGDEVITVATGFPTTVNPILQNGLVPVFVDVELGTYNIRADMLEDALSPRTKVVMAAHTLGNPFDLGAVVDFVRKHNLWLIEDNCDAVGSTYRGVNTGTFGDLATVSFYPAHHLTMGEGGCVLCSGALLARIVESYRDWGRDCWCEPGEDDRCNRRFKWQVGSLPAGYDHKYIFSHIGYNLKSTDIQAALGLSQLKKLPDFIATRRRNWRRLRAALADLEEFFMLPRATTDSEPSWFGFLLTIQEDAPFSRNDLIAFLESRKIGTRLLFGGNITRQPAYRNKQYRIVGDLANSDVVTERSFWVGVYPGLSTEMIDYIAESIHDFVNRPHTRPSAGEQRAVSELPCASSTLSTLPGY